MVNLSWKQHIREDSRRAVAHFACPYCGAQKGQRCGGPGRPTEEPPHTLRLELVWLDQAKKREEQGT